MKKIIFLSSLLIANSASSAFANTQVTQVVVSHVEPTLIRDCFHDTRSLKPNSVEACQEIKDAFWDLQILRKGLYEVPQDVLPKIGPPYDFSQFNRLSNLHHPMNPNSHVEFRNPFE